MKKIEKENSLSKIELVKMEVTYGVNVIDQDPSLNQDPAHKAITTDEYAGQGGSYIFDPVTGKRTPVPDTI